MHTFKLSTNYNLFPRQYVLDVAGLVKHELLTIGELSDALRGLAAIITPDTSHELTRDILLEVKDYRASRPSKANKYEEAAMWDWIDAQIIHAEACGADWDLGQLIAEYHHLMTTVD